VPYRDLWHAHLRDAANDLPQAAVRETVRTRLTLTTEQLIMDHWSREVEAPIRQRLALLMEESIGTVMTQADLPQPTRMLLRLPEVQQRIALQVGTEIVSVSRTTLRTVRQVLREGWQQGQTPAAIATRLKTVLGLTPRQERTLTLLRTRAQAAGKTARQVETLVRQARATALIQRALMIARTETTTAMNQGAYETLQVLAQQGQLVSPSLLRRYWVTTGAACAVCAAIPGMNPGGVPLEQPFQTPEGPVWYPALHAACNCVVASSYTQEG
jgi:hypothetical protein